MALDSDIEAILNAASVAVANRAESGLFVSRQRSGTRWCATLVLTGDGPDSGGLLRALRDGLAAHPPTGAEAGPTANQTVAWLDDLLSSIETGFV